MKTGICNLFRHYKGRFRRVHPSKIKGFLSKIGLRALLKMHVLRKLVSRDYLDGKNGAKIKDGNRRPVAVEMIRGGRLSWQELFLQALFPNSISACFHNLPHWMR
jgi:hypothetical protein